MEETSASLTPSAANRRLLQVAVETRQREAVSVSGLLILAATSSLTFLLMSPGATAWPRNAAAMFFYSRSDPNKCPPSPPPPRPQPNQLAEEARPRVMTAPRGGSRQEGSPLTLTVAS